MTSADQNKRAGLEKNFTLPAFLLCKIINEQNCEQGGKKTEKSKRACSSIRDFRLLALDGE